MTGKEINSKRKRERGGERTGKEGEEVKLVCEVGENYFFLLLRHKNEGMREMHHTRGWGVTGEGITEGGKPV